MLKIKSFVFNPISVNTYVLYNENKQCVIVDAGNSSPKEDEEIFSYIDKNKLVPLMVLDTHGHIDHIVGNASLCRRYNIPVAAHHDGKTYYDRVWMYAAAFGWDYDNDSTVFPSIDLHDGMNINIGDDVLTVLFTPGHAKGSVCFYCEAGGFVFTGDTLFLRSIGRTDLPGGNYYEIKESIQKKLYKLPDATVCFCGHGPETTIGDEKRLNSEITEE